jgi:hypothetical protein
MTQNTTTNNTLGENDLNILEKIFDPEGKYIIHFNKTSSINCISRHDKCPSSKETRITRR